MPEVADQADHQQQFFLVFILLRIKCPTYEKIHQCRQPQKQNEWRIPGGIKNITGNQQIYFFCLPRERHIMQNQHNDEKNKKGV